MGQDISVLSFAAAGIYTLVLLACLGSGVTSRSKHQPNWHTVVWVLLAVLFLALIGARITGFETELSGALRDAIRSSGEYDDRRSLQGLVVSALVVIFTVFAFAALYRSARAVRGRRSQAALIALASGWAMVMLVILRIVSLHTIDRALYGPLKLNWFVDLGSSMVVMAAALYYIKLVRARP